MDLNRFLKEISSGEWSKSVVLAYGGEALGVEETYTAILRALESAGVNVLSVEGRQMNKDALLEELSQVSLFSERRVVAMSGLPTRADALSAVIDHVLSDPDLFLLIRAADNVDRRVRWFKAVSRRGVAFHFDMIREKDMPDRIRTQAKLQGATIGIEVAQSLASRVGTDLLTARNEIEKLTLYVHPRTTIEISDVEAVVGRSRDTILWEITEGISGRNRSRAIADLRDLLAQGESGIAILSLLAREIRFLLQARIFLRAHPEVRGLVRSYPGFQAYLKNDLPEEWRTIFGSGKANFLRMHPYAAWLRLGRALRFKTEELFRILVSLARADRSIKTGAGSAGSVLLSAVAAATGVRT